MLIQRIFSAIILICLLVFIYWFDNYYLYAGFAGVLVVLMVVEYNRMHHSGYVALMFSCAMLFLTVLFILFDHSIIVAVAMLWVLIVACFLLLHSKINLVMQSFMHPVASFIIWSAFFAAFFSGMLKLESNFFYPIALTAAMDIGAYFGGKAFGRHLLSPQISPGKTWEGFFAGFVATQFVAVVLFAHTHHYATFDSIIILHTMIALLVIFGAVGDLFESALKRKNKIKDSGTILPGHGGILDRVDSLFAVVPLYLVMGL